MRPAPRGLRPRTVRALVLTLLLVGTLVAGLFIHPPYAVMRPGPVYDTLGSLDGKPVIEVTGAESYDADGDLDFTTVAVYGGPGREINLWDYVIARLQRTSEVRPVEELYPPNVSREQIQEQTRLQMRDAQAEAKAVALRATGRTVPEKVLVASVLDGGPAVGLLRPEDRVVEFGGAPLTSATDLREGIQKLPAGAPAKLVVERAGEKLPVEVPTVEREGRRLIGVGLAVDFDFPVQVEIHAGDIGGPSAGLMFSLGLYDRLTPGSLTGGVKIAGTGTIADDGTVGPIGGIQHKMRGARDNAGAAWFLAPADNCAATVGNVPDGLRVVRVATFDEGRHAVEEIAAGRGDALPTCG